MVEMLNPPQDQVRSTSHGRGGAGNIAKRNVNDALNPEDFKTPTIKNDLYTTGRGGTGNMAMNLKEVPEMARAAQDVEAPVAHHKEAKGTIHWGRGGQGNKTTVGMTREEEKAAQQQERRARSKERTSSGTKDRASLGNIVDKGKDMLGLGGKKKSDADKNGPVGAKNGAVQNGNETATGTGEPVIRI
ncbi:hypothetical protein K431DRAFT_277411 [Polychaeton citri CBS 116435]|uniref:Uncharacterized protein n=1 Tax=Polychaeton citri CBS 116435 TaxID=1314669 RepID=A0A9P4UK75_9PEZI|nr:hypothetical protein K431DRAFT_277411 [Polychaeton citri CBS 116435]